MRSDAGDAKAGLCPLLPLKFAMQGEMTMRKSLEPPGKPHRHHQFSLSPLLSALRRACAGRVAAQPPQGPARPSPTPGARLHYEPLEPRLLLSGDPLALAGVVDGQVGAPGEIHELQTDDLAPGAATQVLVDRQDAAPDLNWPLHSLAEALPESASGDGQGVGAFDGVGAFGAFSAFSTFSELASSNHAPSFPGSTGIVSTDAGSAYDWAYGIAIQPDGKYLVTGATDVGGYADFTLLRYHSDGSLDRSFDGDGQVTTALGSSYDSSYALAVQPDGKILVGGYSSQGATASDFALVRYRSDGSLDTSFSGDGKVTTDIGHYWDQAYSMALQTDGAILLAGFSSGSSSADSDFAVLRYTSNGSLDASFDGDGKLVSSAGYRTEALRAVTVQPDGKIIAVGYADNSDGLARGRDLVLLRYHRNGSLDSGFDGDGIVTADFSRYDLAYSVTLQSDGKILLLGTSGDAFFLLRYHSDGSPDADFGDHGKVASTLRPWGSGNLLTVQSDGKIVLVGTTYHSASDYDLALARYRVAKPKSVASLPYVSLRRFPEMEIPTHDSCHPRASGVPPFGPM